MFVDRFAFAALILHELYPCTTRLPLVPPRADLASCESDGVLVKYTDAGNALVAVEGNLRMHIVFSCYFESSRTRVRSELANHSSARAMR